MKYLFIFPFILSSMLLASATDNKETLRTKKHINEQIEKEKKYAKEQRFYSGKDYNLKESEVNMDSVKNLPDIPDDNEDFDMNDAYD